MNSDDCEFSLIENFINSSRKVSCRFYLEMKKKSCLHFGMKKNNLRNYYLHTEFGGVTSPYRCRVFGGNKTFYVRNCDYVVITNLINCILFTWPWFVTHKTTMSNLPLDINRTFHWWDSNEVDLRKNQQIWSLELNEISFEIIDAKRNYELTLRMMKFRLAILNWSFFLALQP